jgi:adenylate cyclase
VGIQGLHQKTIKKKLSSNFQEPIKISLISLTITGLCFGIRTFGWLQPLELAVYDAMMRFRPDAGIDSRLLLVAITEADIRNQNRWPLSDQTLAQVLETLLKHQPSAIGLDIFRDIPYPPGHDQLQQQLKNPKIIVATSLGNNEEERIPPPPGVSAKQVGFINVLIDPDTIIRRNYLYANTGTKILRSFSLRLALTYLKQQGISEQYNNPAKHLQLNQALFVPLEPTSGGYQTINAGGYQILLNYRSPRQIARQVTLTEVLAGQLDPTWVKDNIVLIGATAPSRKDLFYTPYSATVAGNRKMPGVVVHAQMVSQLLDVAQGNRPLFWFWSDSLELLWIALWTFAGSLVAWKFHQPLKLILSSLALLGTLFGTGILLFLIGGWIPITTPALSTIITLTLVVVTQLQDAIRQHQTLMKLLGQQTSPEIADALWNNRHDLLEEGILPGEELIATILLTDIKGFSTLAEQHSPKFIMQWLNQYIGVMTGVVQHHQGIINKFTGDGLLAIFGVPVKRMTPAEIDQDAQNAVGCALAMASRLGQLNQQWRQQGWPEIQMRVGIYTGPVMVGSLGSKDRLEYGVIGDSVNIAARLESCEKHRQPDICRIIIAQETLDHLQGKFQVEPWGTIPLKGKEQTVDIYHVLGDHTQNLSNRMK